MRFFALRRAMDLEYLDACLRSSLSCAAEGMSGALGDEGVPASSRLDGAISASEWTGASTVGPAIAFVITGTSCWGLQ